VAGDCSQYPEIQPVAKSTVSEAKPSGLGGLLFPLLIALAGAAAYANSLSVPFLFDDDGSIATNASLLHWGSVFWPPIGTTVGGRPFLNLSFALNHAISGTAVWSYHVLNAAVHVLAGLTLFGIVRRTLAPRSGRAASLTAFSVALLWIVHPLQTESVTYIVQRAESLMGLLYLLTLYCFIRGALAEPRSGRNWFALSALACLLGIATKEVMVSAPLVALLYDRTFLAGSFREAWRLRWRAYGALAATWLLLLFLTLSTHGRGGTAGLASRISAEDYALTQFAAIVHYLRLCFWPHPLIFSYGSTLALEPGRLRPAALTIGALLAAGGWALVKRPALGFLCGSFFLILAPTSSILPIATETMAEQRMYLPLICVVVLGVLGITRWLGRGGLLFCLMLAAPLFAATLRRNEVYSDPVRLWSETVANCPDNFYAHDDLGCELAKIPGRANDAIAQFEEALRLNPDLAEAHFNLGCELQTMPGGLAEAVAQYEDAIRLSPDNFQAHTNLANALAAQGRIQEAIAHYKTVLRLRPDMAEVHFNLAIVLLGTADGTAEAIEHLKAGLSLQPGNDRARQLLSRITGPQP
jgi:tetratricopeptide (TPR) repeat protein